MHLDGVLTVLECVAERMHFERQFAPFANGDESDAEFDGEWRGKDKTTRLGGRSRINLLAMIV